MSSVESRQQLLMADYQATLGVFNEYRDVRFRLLALVPLATAIGAALAGQEPDFLSAGIAAGALVAIFGIVMYDLRNSLFYDSVIHRSKELERLLELPRTNFVNGDSAVAGIFSERPRDRFTLLGVRVWHDRALNIVYSSSAAAWSGLLAVSLAVEAEWPAGEDQRWLVAGIAAVGAFVGSFTAIENAEAQIGRIRQKMAPEGD